MADRGRFELEGRGSDLAIRVYGPDLTACLAAAVEGLAASLADVGSDLARRRLPLEVDGDSPEDLLVGLVDEAILRLDADGDLPVGLTDVALTQRGLRGMLEVVDLAAARVHGVAPKAATWHEVRLEPVDNTWQGYLMLDL
ncbi:MAG TPA: archease [Egibacteraceae bacterium]|nr:archease [Actinomycetota bacterium]HWB72190.1 archease [Egibacteraceae bacterium]